eukprot:TRINITY_DN5427_c2_g2_i1.p2 TRINITY_DN5427_c2_g2~~TRINITY_DN5427_c2_g2_i1.p2  ORF type:complete len:185 (-),score=77.08 TRINITY_DN5427_c2_g2_i1:1352-1906(-)
MDEEWSKATGDRGMLESSLWGSSSSAFDFTSSSSSSSSSSGDASSSDDNTNNRFMNSNEPMDRKSVLDMNIKARGANISGGFAQSIALARVFLRPKAKILILDEALGQMDAYKKREIIMPRLYRYVEQNNMALIMISHDLFSMKEMDYLVLLHSGKLAHQGSHQDLIDQRATIYLKLLGVSADE